MGSSNEDITVGDDGTRSECTNLSKPFQEMHFTPKKQIQTPMKTLPFSPSQFLNSSSLILTEAIMSTPVSASAPKPSAALTPVSRGDYTNLRTPHRGSQEPITRTPTPFKDALAEMEKKGGPINYIVRPFLTIQRSHSMHYNLCDFFSSFLFLTKFTVAYANAV